MTTSVSSRTVGAVLVLLASLVAMPAGAKQKDKVVRLHLGPFRIEAQRDREVCQALRVSGVAGLEVAHWEARSRVSHRGETASHHLVLYGYSGTDSKHFPSDLVDDSAGCAGFGPADFFKARRRAPAERRDETSAAET